MKDPKRENTHETVRRLLRDLARAKVRPETREAILRDIRRLVAG